MRQPPTSAKKSLLRSILRMVENRLGIQITPIPSQWNQSREQRRIDLSYIEVLADRDFRNAEKSALPHTILDTPRLANLWQLARAAVANAPAESCIVELGVFRGGSSVLLAQACPDHHLIMADTFESFGENFGSNADDRIFTKDQFVNTNVAQVHQLMSSFRSNFSILKGYFPVSDKESIIRNVAFAHIDFDLYQSTAASLPYLADRATAHAVFVLDDFLRNAAGVDRAVAEFTDARRDWLAFPIYPGQCLLARF